ncbi:MAG: PDGLE domain-containing protein [Candidatus Bathyarchaeia archaeon]|nr:hypothetical protein [Candidatus Bathyarchaeota archaeon A05DMB-4]MDH7594582.1 PDGLE domain-containing protein [Candidatus Bathyarchaeota archaeon]
MKSYRKALLLIVIFLIVLIPFASTFPDGLERVAESLGIAEPEPLWPGLMSDYAFPGINNPYVSVLAAGVIGVFLVFSISYVVGYVSTRKHKQTNE